LERGKLIRDLWGVAKAGVYELREPEIPYSLNFADGAPRASPWSPRNILTYAPGR